MADTPLPQDGVEVAVRRYLRSLAGRFLPLVAAGIALILILVLVPPASGPKTRTVASGADATGSGETGGSGGSAAPAEGAGPGGAGTGASGQASFKATGRQVAVPAGVTPPAAAGSAGVTRSGVQCGPGVRQVTWSVYAPTCIPAYKGNNGGATSRGVTGDTITATFRRTSSATQKAAYAAVGDAAPGSDDQYLADLRTYVDFFNKNMELYGRKVVVKDFSGQSDNLEETQGRSLAGAQADASEARDLGAFVDITQSPTLASSQPYEERLADEKVITVGAIGLPQSWHERYSPYGYSFAITPDGTTAAQAVVNGACARMVGLPAMYAGDALYQKQNRVWGLVTPENPVYMELGNQIEQGLKQRCGVTLARRINYAINIPTMGQQSVSIVAQLKAANVTTPICVCDPIVEITIAQAANSQQYRPEWLAVSWGDPQGRQVDQEQMRHTLAYYGTYPQKKQTEAYRVFKLANPAGEPQEQYYPVGYYVAMHLFSILQAAGPNLTPVSFRDGAFAIPKSPLGDAGIWGGGPGRYSQLLATPVARWNPDAPSGFDGKKGAWLSCDGGKWYSYLDPAGWGAARTQFQC